MERITQLPAPCISTGITSDSNKGNLIEIGICRFWRMLLETGTCKARRRRCLISGLRFRSAEKQVPRCSYCATPRKVFGRPGAEGTPTFENPWVSVQDVVLNSLEPSTLPSQPLPELSHFYTSTKQRRNVLLMSLWFLLLCHALTQK